VLEKGTLKLGSVVDFRGHTSFAWRHWGCTTTIIINNMKKSFPKADKLDGFDELQPEDQDKIRKAWDDGHVADEDVPETARKSDAVDDTNEEAKPKKKRAPSKKDSEGDVPKPKKARASKKTDEEGDIPAGDDGEKEEPKKAPASKPRSKKAKDEDKQLNGKEEDEGKTGKKAGPTKKLLLQRRFLRRNLLPRSALRKRMQKSLVKTLPMSSMMSQLLRKTNHRSLKIRNESVLRRSLPQQSPRRRKRNRLLVVPKRSSQVMGEKRKNEIISLF